MAESKGEALWFLQPGLGSHVLSLLPHFTGLGSHKVYFVSRGHRTRLPMEGGSKNLHPSPNQSVVWKSEKERCVAAPLTNQLAFVGLTPAFLGPYSVS